MATEFKMQPIIFSEEQKQIAAYICNDMNVIANAVAGSGKTSTIELITQYYQYPITVLTYNKSLADESRERITRFRRDVKVSTLHSFAQKIYGVPCNTDKGLNNIIQNNCRPTKNLKIKLLVIDETQDMKPLFYKFIIKLIVDIANIHLRLLILGDVYQCIYKFMDSNPEYLTKANVYFGQYVYGNWYSMNLSVSYRITKPMAEFINKVLFKKQYIQSVKDGPKVIYIKTSLWSNNFKQKIVQIIKSTVGNNYSNVAILAKSVKCGDRHPVTQLENYLKLALPDCNIFCPRQDDSELDSSLIRNKLVISSIHSFKGRERPLVIFMGFDNSYYYNNNLQKYKLPTDRCPEEIYVASSRASKVFVACHNEKEAFMSFMDVSQIANICSTDGSLAEIPIVEKSKTEHKYSVSKLCSHISFSLKQLLFNFITYEKIQGQQVSNIPEHIVQFQTISEQVSHLYGIIIPGHAEKLMYRKEPSYITVIKNAQLKIGTRLGTELTECRKWIDNSNKTYSEYAKLSNIYVSVYDGYCSNLDQISDYDWVNDQVIENLSLRIQHKLDESKNEYKFERGLHYSTYYGDNIVSIYGAIDALNDEYLYEFKCSGKEKDEYIFQAVTYLCLLYLDEKIIRKVRLYYPTLDITYNIEIKDIHQNAANIMNLLVGNKMVIGDNSSISLPISIDDFLGK